MLGRLASFVCATTLAAAAYAQPVTHPIWASTPNAEWDATALAQFAAAASKRGLGAPEVLPLNTVPSAPAPELFAAGMAALGSSSFDKAAELLGRAAKAALETGAAGLAPGQAASLFFHQAIAIQLAAGTSYSEPFREITPPTAKTAYLRAAVLGGGATLDDEANQPLSEASWRMAKALVGAWPRTTLTVKAHARATVSVDGGARQPSPASFTRLPIGEHFILVEEPGHLPWSTTLSLAGAANHLDVPATELLALDAATAAGRARARGAAFALVGELRIGTQVEVDLRLVNANTAQVEASTAVAVADKADALDMTAAVLRLDEMAAASDLASRTRRAQGLPPLPLSVAAPPPPAPTAPAPDIRQDTRGWLRLHWPLATAVGTVVATSLVLGIVVAKDTR